MFEYFQKKAFLGPKVNRFGHGILGSVTHLLMFMFSVTLATIDVLGQSREVSVWRPVLLKPGLLRHCSASLMR